MLRQLSIRNFAIVDSVTLEFAPGFNVLTGETGAGKSLIVDALYFLLGDRMAADMLRAGEERAVAEALFQVPAKGAVTHKLSEWGINATSGEVLLKREFTRSSGKTRSFVNGEMATAAMIAELGDMLVDIHGQHEHQAIFNVGRHRQLIDAFGCLDKPLEEVSEAYKALSGLLLERSRLGGDSREIARRTDLLQFQVQEIEASGLESLNEEELFGRYQAMKHGEKITKHLTESLGALDEEGDGGATGLFGLALTRLTDAARLDPELEKWVEKAKEIQESLNQLSFELSGKLDGYSFSESEFQELSEQIDGLNSLKKKYGDSAVEILKYLEQSREELKNLLGREDRLRALEGEIEKYAERYRAASAQLSAKRVKAGGELTKEVQDALRELGLPHAQMGVLVTPQEEVDSPVMEKGKRLLVSPAGWDKVEFLFSANPGEPVRPLAKVASGGEASRVMLALKAVLAESDEVGTLIFDEIDTGVGARTASAVARLLGNLSKSKQVLCISHLAPIAGLGECHYQISKTVVKGKTSIHVNRLTENGRIDELAKMLGGEPVSETSRSHAKELYARMRGN
ncbi:MAG TPA: DNA repair protein RecN [bacterium]|nr:DNA repair protein RecN [bacterium]